jgi:hypothetical protein
MSDAVQAFVAFRPEEHEPVAAVREVYFALKPVFATS